MNTAAEHLESGTGDYPLAEVTARGGESAAHRGGSEHHRQEEQAAAEGDGAKELVLEAPKVGPHHTDEPQEADAGERHQLRSEPDFFVTRLEPL